METIIAIALVVGNLVAIGAHLAALEPRYGSRGRSIVISMGGLLFALGSLFVLAVIGSTSALLGLAVAFSAFLSVVAFLLGPMNAGSEA